MKEKNQYQEVKREVKKEGNLKHRNSRSLVKKRMIKKGLEKRLLKKKEENYLNIPSEKYYKNRER